MKRSFLVIAVLGVFFISVGMKPKKSAPSYKQKLSEYGFFTGNMADLKPAEGVVPYELNSPLFSDYALKSRFVRLPEGQAAVYNEEDVFEFPQGTAIIKTFYYAKDASKPQKGNQIIETRVLLHEQNGWVALPYVWDAAQKEAVLEIAGASKMVQWKNESGKKVKVNYQVPNMVQCKACHASDKDLVPIGPSARQLNGSFTYTVGKKNQLLYWKEKGLLTGLPDLESVPKMASWSDASIALEDRARAYLDANCGHCHRHEGAANTSGMFLDIHTNTPAELGVNKAPIAAGRGTGNRLYGIVPGQADASILLYRMESDDPGIRMPEVGRQLVHQEGIDLIREWIESMPE